MYEDTFVPGKVMRLIERAEFLEPLVVGSVLEAQQRRESLALIRPKQSRFHWRKKSSNRIDAERKLFQRSALQASLLDKELAEIEPTPYDFRLDFEDANGWHKHLCGDWETTAAFWKLSRKYGEGEALRHLDVTYNQDYPSHGMVLAMGNMARRPQTWLLLGVIRVDRVSEGRLIP